MQYNYKYVLLFCHLKGFITIIFCLLNMANSQQILQVYCSQINPLYYLLGVCLLQQGAPEFVIVTRMDEDQLAIVGGEPVINDNVHPLAKVPEMEAENPGIAFAPALIRGNNLTKKGGKGRNDCKSWIPYFTDEYFILSE